jgi:hypothetical protein
VVRCGELTQFQQIADAERSSRFIFKELQMNDQVRVSIVCLCIIRNSQSEYLLGINVNRMRDHHRVLMPLGGAYAYEPNATVQDWIQSYETVDSRDLRFRTHPEHLCAIQSWFVSRKQRETTPLRELQEELVEEYCVLDVLASAQLEMKLLGLLQSVRVTDRVGSEGLLTHYFIELFEVRFVSPEVQGRVFGVAPDSGLYWVSEQTIRQRFLPTYALPIEAEILLPPFAWLQT